MCGIAGIVCKDRARKLLSRLRNMLEVIHHRGPDEQNSTAFDGCILGHVRLSIVDLISGQQPMKSPVSECTIVFNGEIYGYKELKQTYVDYPFKNNSDTELVLALHDKYGKDMMKYLPGMFAFAIWDNKEQKLFCARDRFGEKPFYYAFGKNGEFIFGSEIKAILASGLIEPEIDIDSMGHFLKYMYVSPLKTIYKNVFILPPAHTLEFQNGKLSVERYWDLPSPDYKITAAEAVENFRSLFQNSIRKMMVADVPVGAFLSGGLDSSTIVIEAAKHTSKLTTISFGFDGNQSELPYAREVAQRCGTNHMELTDVRNDLAQLFVETQNFQDEPFADMAQIPLYLISQEARKYLKVVMAGDGADELLGGYVWRHLKWFNLDKEAKQFSTYWYLLNRFRYLLKKAVFIKDKALKDKIKGYKYLHKKNIDWLELHMASHALLSNDDMAGLGLGLSANYSAVPEFAQTGTPDDTLRCDLVQYMPGDILVKTDRVMMQASLEGRLPFLDQNLAEFLISLPPELKLDGKVGKLPLRRSYENEWPEDLRNRPKQGFGIPDNTVWLQRDDFKELQAAYLANKKSKIYDFIDFEKSKKYFHKAIWNFLALAVWLEKTYRQK